MTDHPSPEQEAARITGELESITEACPSNPCLRSCNLCPDCLTKLEEAIAAALAAKDAEIVALRDNNERVKELFDQRAVALTQALARAAQLRLDFLELAEMWLRAKEGALGLADQYERGKADARGFCAESVREALRATSPEER